MTNVAAPSPSHDLMVSEPIGEKKTETTTLVFPSEWKLTGRKLTGKQKVREIRIADKKVT